MLRQRPLFRPEIDLLAEIVAGTPSGGVQRDYLEANRQRQGIAKQLMWMGLVEWDGAARRMRVSNEGFRLAERLKEKV